MRPARVPCTCPECGRADVPAPFGELSLHWPPRGEQPCAGSGGEPAVHGPARRWVALVQELGASRRSTRLFCVRPGEDPDEAAAGAVAEACAELCPAGQSMPFEAWWGPVGEAALTGRREGDGRYRVRDARGQLVAEVVGGEGAYRAVGPEVDGPPRASRREALLDAALAVAHLCVGEDVQ